jgi:REP element-mobilizing transposase RayT
MSIWLLTSTCYGTWLPGDARGSVTRVRDRRPGDRPSSTRILHNQIGEQFEPIRPELRASALAGMKGHPIRLTSEQAAVVVAQFQETCEYRSWRLLAAAVMWNHFHLVVNCDNSRAEKSLADLKAYASRALNHRFGQPESGTWWTNKGSKRLLANEIAVAAAIEYVLRRQPRPLAVWPESSCPATPGDDASGSEE